MQRKALLEAGDFVGLKLPKKTSPVRLHNRCKLTGRPELYASIWYFTCYIS
jgi:small subunit ribosomal protein S14